MIRENFNSNIEEVQIGNVKLPEILKYNNSDQVYNKLEESKKMIFSKIDIYSNISRIYKKEDFNNVIKEILCTPTGTYGGANLYGIASRICTKGKDTLGNDYYKGGILVGNPTGVIIRDIYSTIDVNDESGLNGTINVNVRPVVEISLDKYKLENKEGYIEDEHSSVETAWEIRKR